MKNPILLHLMAFMYVGLGLLHLIKPGLYRPIIPSWMPFKLFVIYASGGVEMVLGTLLLLPKTRIIAAKLIIALLVMFFFAIHVPQAMEYYQTGNKYFLLTLFRLPVQLVLIAWAGVYARPDHASH